jgi:hypothetical protein
MKERVGRVEEGKEMSDLPSPYPGGERMKPNKSQMWLEEEKIRSSNHPAQALNESLSSLKVGPESDPLLGAILVGMIVSRVDEERGSSA